MRYRTFFILHFERILFDEGPLNSFRHMVFFASEIFAIYFLRIFCFLIQIKGLGGFQRLETGTFLLFFFIYPMEYFIQTVYHIKDTYLISNLWNVY